VGVEARRCRALSIRLLTVPGQRNDVDPSAQSEPKSARHFVSVHIRQTHINEDVLWTPPQDEFDSILTRGRGTDLVAHQP
jgi:hypothetical protein